MALTDPYGQNHYLGEYVSNTDVETFLTSTSWPLSNGVLYYNTTDHEYRARIDGQWRSIELALMSGIGRVDRVHVDASSRATSYKVLTIFSFRGTTAWGTPHAIRILAKKKSGIGGVRIYDVTNHNQVAIKSGISNTGYTLLDMGTLSNLPTAESIFEVQGKKVTVQEVIMEY